MRNSFRAFFFIWVIVTAGLLGLTGTSAAYVLEGEASYRPWSGYWWPFWEAGLPTGKYYRGHPAPLEKYDLVTSGYFPGRATRTELTNHRPETAQAWEGYCHAWANAAILETVDFENSVLDGCFFSIGDKKGLLTVCHYDDYKMFQRCGRNPLVFHQYLLEYVGKNRVPVAADLDGGEQVWSYPIYRFRMDIAQGGESDYISCTIFYADDQVGPDFQGTREESKTLYYRLFKDAHGSYTYGEWAGATAGRGPDFVWLPVGQKAENSHIDYEQVGRIVSSRGDGFNPSGIVRPGSYPLIVSPGRQIGTSIHLPAESRVKIRLAVDGQSPGEWRYPRESVSYLLKHTGGAIIASGGLDTEGVDLEFSQESASDIELILISSDGNQLDVFVRFYLDVSLKENCFLLNIPNNYEWIGMALKTVDPDVSNLTYVTVMGEGGWPIHTLDVPLNMNGNLKWSGLVPTPLMLDYFNGSGPEYVKITSERPVALLGLVSAEADTLTGPPQPTSSGCSTWIVPKLTRKFSTGFKSNLYLLNTGSEDIITEMDYYSNLGTWVGEEYFSILPGQFSEYRVGNYPGSIDVDGWAVLRCESGSLTGKVEITGRSSIDELPLLKAGTRFFLPHLVDDGLWATKAVLINPHGEPVNVTLTCRNGGRVGEPCVVELGAFERREVDMKPYLWAVTQDEMNACWLLIDSPKPIAGYFTYSCSDVSAASMPFFPKEDLGLEKNICHVAGDNYWWTGVALLNPSAVSSEIEFTAYGESGDELARHTITIGAGAKQVFMLDQCFPQLRGLVKSVRLRSGGGAFSGFLLYGTSDGVSLLSALVLK
ncbi:MAG TPA: hypothetical protein EYP57_03380 [Thermodesulfobacteriaceae bacterium]|nr:hypothetical protein [Thermodesulfobacteriaceae bacterium]